MAKLRTLLPVLGVVVAIVAFWLSQNLLLLRHYIVLVTLGQLKALPTYTESCDTTPILRKADSTRFSKHKHCFDKDGNVPVFDAAHNVTRFQHLLMDAVEKRCPVLIKRPFKDGNCYQRLQKLGDQNSEFTIRIKENRPEWMDKTHWFPLQEGVYGGGERPAYRAPLKELLDEYESGPSMRYTSFDTSLNGNNYSAIWDLDLGFIRGRAGTAFMSRYNETVITTPMHSGMWDSFGYQCVGTKNWKMLTPEDALPTVRLHHVFTFMKGCNGRKDVEDMMFDAQSGPDTMFYFPSFWAHAVKTDAGKSVLLNFRALYFPKMFKDNLLMGIHVMTGLIWYRVFHESWDPEEVTYFYTTGNKPKGGGNNNRSSDFKSSLLSRLISMFLGDHKAIEKLD